jgi:hypothetical protein
MEMLLSQSGPSFALGGVMIFLCALAILASVFWLWMLIDVLAGDLNGTDKLIWVLVVLFLHLLGAILYFVMKRREAHTGYHTALP